MPTAKDMLKKVVESFKKTQPVLPESLKRMQQQQASAQEVKSAIEKERGR